MLVVCVFAQSILVANITTMVIQIIAGILVYVIMLYILKDDYLKLFIEKAKNIIFRKNINN